MSYSGEWSATVEHLRNYLVQMEHQLVVVHDTGVSAVRILHDEIHDRLRNRPPLSEAHDLGDAQSQINDLRSNMDHATVIAKYWESHRSTA
eukprot:1306407-Pyramimonas_sp.AAC.1